MCYLGPTTAAIVTTFMWKSKKTPRLFWLMLMFYGGALFGVIDHLWNGEIFLVSKDWVKDVMLGIVITVMIILTWGIISALAKRNPAWTIYPTLTGAK
ncbi:MAG: hypothetical protein NC898_06680, partial [Candidatus Omnitrophica bacterium]|nr:hypothetical protein [Candidatus Omnitrophota bacterium]